MEERGINVLSLFDGMACTRMALEVRGVKVNKYFASEVDKYSIQMSKHLYPDIVHLGDVQFITAETFGNVKIDLFVGGSPCTGFSNAGRMLNFKDPRSALFFDYVRLLRDLKKKNSDMIFLLENVKMKGEWRDIISKYMGVEPIFLNSALLSAQNRQRYYWTNIEGVEQPEDRGIVLRDILESGMVDSEKPFCIDGNYFKGGNPKQYFEKSRRQLVFEQHGDKLRVPEATKKGYAEAGEGEGLDLSFPKSKTRRGRLMKDKSNCVTSAGQDMGVVVNDDGVQLKWRKLTVRECARLQTVPEHIIDRMMESGVSNSQMYKQLGNGFTVDVIAHILSFAKFV